MAMVRAWLGWVLVATAQAACSQSDTQVTGCSAAGCSTVATCSSGYAVACATSPAATGDGITPTSTSCTAFTGLAAQNVDPIVTCETGCDTSSVVASGVNYESSATLTASCTGTEEAVKCYCHSYTENCGTDQSFDPDDSTTCSKVIGAEGASRRRSARRRRTGAMIYALCQTPPPTPPPTLAPTGAPTSSQAPTVAPTTGAPSSAPTTAAPSFTPTTFAPSQAPTTASVCVQTEYAGTGCSSDSCNSVVSCGQGYLTGCTLAPDAKGDGIVPSSTSCTSYTGNAAVTVTPTAICEVDCFEPSIEKSSATDEFLEQQTVTATCTGSGETVVDCYCYSPSGLCGISQKFAATDSVTCSMSIGQASQGRRRSVRRRRLGAIVYALCQKPIPTASPTFAPSSAPSSAPTSAPSATPSSSPTSVPTTFPTFTYDVIVEVDLFQVMEFNSVLTPQEETTVIDAYKADMTQNGVDSSEMNCTLTRISRRTVQYNLTATASVPNSTNVQSVCGNNAFVGGLQASLSSLGAAVSSCTTNEAPIFTPNPTSLPGNSTYDPTISPTVAPTEEAFLQWPPTLEVYLVLGGGLVGLVLTIMVCVCMYRKCTAPIEEEGWFTGKKPNDDETDGDTTDGEDFPALAWHSPKMQQKMLLSMMGGDSLTDDARATIALNKLAKKMKRSHHDKKHASKRERDEAKSPKSRWQRSSKSHADKDKAHRRASEKEHLRSKGAGSQKVHPSPSSSPLGANIDASPTLIPASPQKMIEPPPALIQASPKRSPTVAPRASLPAYQGIKPTGQVLTLQEVPVLTEADIREAVAMDGKKKAFQKLALSWHPDKFNQRFGSMLLDHEADAVTDRVKKTYQMIQLLARVKRNSQVSSP